MTAASQLVAPSISNHWLPLFLRQLKGSLLVNLPDELLLATLRLLDPIDILRSRQSCSRLYLISLDISLWTDVASRLSRSLPLPSSARISTFTLSELEYTTVRAVNVEEQWLNYRSALPRKISVKYQASHPTNVQLFEGRYALICYPRVVLLWDIDIYPDFTREDTRWGRVIARRTGGSIAFESYSARYHEATQEIFVSFVELVDRQRILIVLSVSLSGLPARTCQFRQLVRSSRQEDGISPSLYPTNLHPGSSCVAQHMNDTIRVIDWKDGHSKNLTKRKKSDKSVLWKELILIANEIIEPYVLTVRPNAYSVRPNALGMEIYAIPSGYTGGLQEVSAQMEVTEFPNVSFTDASFSFLPADQDNPTSLSIVLILTDMFNLVNHYIIHLPREPSETFSCTPILLNQGDLTLRDIYINTGLALGPRGRRAAWIEKSRTKRDHNVVASSLDNKPTNGSREMRTGELYRTYSRHFDHEIDDDDDDDLESVSFDEVTGRVVLVTRGGELWVLDCWRGAGPTERKPLARFQGSWGR